MLAPQQYALPLTISHAWPEPAEIVAGGHGVTVLVPAGELPAVVVATTLTVYVVPLVRPVSVHDSVVVEQVEVPGDADTEYPVTVPVPAADADQYTTADPLAPNAATLPGAVATQTDRHRHVQALRRRVVPQLAADAYPPSSTPGPPNPART